MFTTDYTTQHRAILGVSRDHGLRPFEVRVVAAIYELRPGERETRVPMSALVGALADDEGQTSGSGVRRALGVLYDKELADGEPRKPGIETKIMLTPAGETVAEQLMNLATRNGGGD